MTQQRNLQGSPPRLREVRCPRCGRLLLKAAGRAVVETVCPRCKELVLRRLFA